MPPRRRPTLLLLAAVIAIMGIAPVAPDAAEAAVTLEAPRRVLDTRVGLSAAQRPLTPGQTLRLDISGVQPRADRVVVLNLTGDQAAEPGFVSARPCDEPDTKTSILNVYPGRAVPNSIVLAYEGASLCFESSTSVDLIADLTSVVDGDIRAVQPDRIFDSRDSQSLRPGREYRFRIASNSGVPRDAVGAAFNVTVVNPTAAGYVLVQPCGGGSSASTLNFLSGEVVPHFTFSALADGDVCISTLVQTDLIIDVFGWMPAAGELELVAPGRALDTRSGFGGTRGGLRDGQRISVQIGGRAGTRAGADVAAVNIVGVNSTAFGFLNAWPCDQQEPDSSIVNLWPGSVRANQAVVALADDGTLCLRARVTDGQRIDVVIDVVGYTGGTGAPSVPVDPPPPPPVDPPPVPTGRFETLPVGSALPSGAECASRVRSAPEIRPENNAANNTRPGPVDLRRNDWAGFDRVDGNFVGTTDEIIQWAACKWGIDEDIARAQVIKESYWYQSTNGDAGESWGLGQVRISTDHPEFRDAVRDSSAFNLDYTYASWRACYEGVYTWLNSVERNGTYGPGDEWGCMGVWFSGRWYVGVDAYLNQPGDSVRHHVENRTWETAAFING